MSGHLSKDERIYIQIVQSAHFNWHVTFDSIRTTLASQWYQIDDASFGGNYFLVTNQFFQPTIERLQLLLQGLKGVESAYVDGHTVVITLTGR